MEEKGIIVRNKESKIKQTNKQNLIGFI